MASTVPEQHVGQSVATFHPRVPRLHDRRHALSHSEITTALPATMATTVRGLAAATARMRATSSVVQVEGARGRLPRRTRRPPRSAPRGAGGSIVRSSAIWAVNALDQRRVVVTGEEVGRDGRWRTRRCTRPRRAGCSPPRPRPRRRRRPGPAARCEVGPVVLDHRGAAGSAARSPSATVTTSGAQTSLDPPSPRLTAVASAPIRATDPSGAEVQRQERRAVDRLVAQEHHRLGRRLPGQCPVGGAGQHAPVPGAGLPEDVGEPEPGGHHPLDGLVDLGPGGLAGVEVVRAGARPGSSGRASRRPDRRAATGPRRGGPRIQSLITKPSNPHSSRRTSVRRARLWPHHSPLTLL